MKKGFTLTEMLGVLIILGLISLVAYPIITSSLKTYRNDLYSSQVNNIIGATKSYVSDNIDTIECSNEGSSQDVLLTTLQNSGYIDENIKNPKTDNNFGATSKVTVTCKTISGNYKYSYQFVEA